MLKEQPKTDVDVIHYARNREHKHQAQTSVLFKLFQAWKKKQLQ